VDVEGHPVRIKVSPGRVKVEHDDAARAARLTGLPLREVLSRAEAAGRAEHGPRPTGSPPDARYQQLSEPVVDHSHPHDHDHDHPEPA
jgi:hypothetical protein